MRPLGVTGYGQCSAGGRQCEDVPLAQQQATFNEGASSFQRKSGPLAPGRYTVRATTREGQVTEKRVRLRARDDEKKVKVKLKD